MSKAKKIFCVVMVFFMTILNGCRAEAGAGGSVAKVAGKVAVGVTVGIFRAIGRAGARVVANVAQSVIKGVAKGVVKTAVVVKNEVEGKIVDEVSAAIVPDKKSVEHAVDNVAENASRAMAFMKEKISDKKSVEHAVDNVAENASRAMAFMKEKISDKILDKETSDKKSDDKLVRVDKKTIGSVIEKNFSKDKDYLNFPPLKMSDKL